MNSPFLQRQLSALICGVFRNEAVCFNILLREISAFLPSKVNRWRRVWDSFPLFLNKGGRASTDWRSEIQVCFQRRV